MKREAMLLVDIDRKEQTEQTAGTITLDFVKGTLCEVIDGKHGKDNSTQMEEPHIPAKTDKE
jgi:hypothetical protein